MPETIGLCAFTFAESLPTCVKPASWSRYATREQKQAYWAKKQDTIRKAIARVGKTSVPRLQAQIIKENRRRWPNRAYPGLHVTRSSRYPHTLCYEMSWTIQDDMASGLVYVEFSYSTTAGSKNRGTYSTQLIGGITIPLRDFWRFCLSPQYTQFLRSQEEALVCMQH